MQQIILPSPATTTLSNVIAGKYEPDAYFAGVVLNQNKSVSGSFSLSTAPVYQTFRLPPDYIRGIGQERSIPNFSGFQVLTTTQPNSELTASLSWAISYYLFGTGWIPVQSGVSVGASATGKVWHTIYFDSPVEINSDLLVADWRIRLQGQTAPPFLISDLVPYTRPYATVNGQNVFAELQAGRSLPIVVDGSAQVLYMDPDRANNVYRYYQYGVTDLWYSSPNPLSDAGAFLYTSDEISTVNVGAGAVSLAFRLLANVAESGTDFLGNRFRGVVKKNSVNNVSALDSALKDKFWLSKPNPSRFAVECLYFDLTSANGAAQVIDRLLLDPLTLGSYFQLYYSSEGAPARDAEAWDEKLWTRVDKSFKMTRRETHVLPEPISAKYVKLEFSFLQAQSYSPGDFQKSIQYRKHPSWVLNYFLVRTEVERQRLQETSAGTVGIVYSALDLAYNYYTEDLTQAPTGPDNVNPSLFTPDENTVDSATLRQIDLAFRPYQRHPALFGKSDYLLASVTSPDSTNYPIEGNPVPFTYDQSVLGYKSNNEVIFESTQPILYYYVKCRHRYRQVSAKLTTDKAFFVGVKQVSFSRDNYTVAHDSDLYVETISDNRNIVRNDFVSLGDGVWSAS